MKILECNKKILILLMTGIIFFSCTVISTKSFAEMNEPDTIKPRAETVTETVKQADTVTKKEKMKSPLDDADNYQTTVKNSPVTAGMIATIVAWVRNIGVIVAVLALTIIGFKYMLAGAAEEKAQYKETMVPVVIGIVMLLGGILLVSAIISLVE